MWADFKASPHQHYYIKEIAQLSNGTFVIPMRWICVVEDDNRVVDCADVLAVVYDAVVSDLQT